MSVFVMVMLVVVLTRLGAFMVVCARTYVCVYVVVIVVVSDSCMCHRIASVSVMCVHICDVALQVWLPLYSVCGCAALGLRPCSAKDITSLVHSAHRVGTNSWHG